MMTDDTTRGCYQLFEVALHHEAALTLPTTFEGAAASWRLLVRWMARQPHFQLIEKVDTENRVYATYRRNDGMLYGLWVKEALEMEVTTPDKMTHGWLARSVDLHPAETVNDYTADPDQTPDSWLAARDGDNDYRMHVESVGV